MYINPYLLFLIILPIYLYVKNSRYGEIFKLLLKYKMKILKKKIPRGVNKYGENEDSKNDKIVPYNHEIINEIIKDTDITKNDTRFLLEVAKIEIQSKQGNKFDDTKYDEIIKQIANKEYSDTQSDVETLRETFIKNYTNMKFDVYSLSDDIKKKIKNYQLDAEIMDEFEKDIKEDIYYLKDLLQVIDDIENLGTTREDKILLKELKQLSNDKKYIMKFKDNNILTQFSPQLYHYIYDGEIVKLFSDIDFKYDVEAFVQKVRTKPLKDIENLSSTNREIYDRRYVPCERAYHYEIESAKFKNDNIANNIWTRHRIVTTDLDTLTSNKIEECFNSRSPSNYIFFLTLFWTARGFVNATEYERMEKGYKYYTDEYTKPNNDEYTNEYTNEYTKTPETPETPKPTTFTLKKSNYDEEIDKLNINENTIKQFTKTCPVYSVLDKELYNDKQSCREQTFKIHPDKNIGCTKLATPVYQDYKKLNICPF